MFSSLCSLLKDGTYFGTMTIIPVSQIGSMRPHAITIQIHDNEENFWVSDIIDFPFIEGEEAGDIYKRARSLLADREIVAGFVKSTGTNQEWSSKYNFNSLNFIQMVKLKKGPLAEKQQLISIEPVVLKLVPIIDE